MNLVKLEASPYKGQIKEMVDFAESLRRDTDEATDISLSEVIEEKFECKLEDLYESLGIDPTVDTINNILTQPDFDVRWLIPEIIRDSIRLGLRTSPIWPNVTAAEQELSQLSVKMPYINMSDAVPRKLGEAETIPLGEISYGDKTVETFKVGRGIKMSYEVRNFVSLDVISIFFQDFGVRLGHALDSLALDVLINGDQANGSDSAAVIGTETGTSKVYKDFLRIWIRGSRMGRNFNTIIGGEDSALETLDLPEFKDRKAGTTDATLNLHTPVPNTANYFIHGNVPADQEIMVDPRFALVKFNVIPLLLESEKIVSNQTEGFYATLTTGFGKLFRDSAIVLDQSITFAGNGFPSYMDVDAYQNVVFE